MLWLVSPSKRGPIYIVFTKFPRVLEVLLKYLSYSGDKKCAKKVKQTNNKKTATG